MYEVLDPDAWANVESEECYVSEYLPGLNPSQMDEE